MSSGDDSKAPSSQTPLYLWGGSLVPNDVQVKLLKSQTDNEPLVDANDPGTRIITCHPFLFLLGLQIPAVEALQGGVLCHGVCSEPVYPQCLPGDHVLREFKSFLHVGADGVRVLLFFQSEALQAVCPISGRWEGDVSDGLLVPTTYCYVWLTSLLLIVSDINKQLELGLDMTKVPCALNILLKFREWRWLLSEWKQNGLDPDDLLAGQEECFTESPPKRKVATKSSRGEATSSHTKNGSPSRKKPRLHSAEKTQVGYAPSSSARVKHTLENHDVLREAARAQPKFAECQRDVDIPPRSSSRLHRKSAHDPVVESQAVKRGVDSVSLTHLEIRLAEAKRMRESYAQAKCSSPALAVDPKANKSSPAGDACVSDMLKTNFLSNLSSCAELVDHIRQAGDLGTFSSLSLEKQREATFHLIKKGLVFAVETIRNSSVVAPSSAQLRELEKKNAELASQLSAE
ncbi:unnamed protein product [Prunus armeniaca]